MNILAESIFDLVPQEELFLLLKTLILVERETLHETVSLLVITGECRDILIDIIRRLPKTKVMQIEYRIIHSSIFIGTERTRPEMQLFENKLLYTEVDAGNFQRDINGVHKTINNGITYRKMYATEPETITYPGTLVVDVGDGYPEDHNDYCAGGRVFTTTKLKRNPIYIHNYRYTIRDYGEFVNRCVCDIKVLSNITKIYEQFSIFRWVIKCIERDGDFAFGLSDIPAHYANFALSTLPSSVSKGESDCILQLFRYFVK